MAGIFALGSFFVALNDRLGSGVVDSKALGDLSDRLESYIDDCPSLLNEPQQFGPDFLTYFFVFFCRQSGFDVDGDHFVENEFDLRSWLLGVYSLDLSTHLLIILYNIIRFYQPLCIAISVFLSYYTIVFCLLTVNQKVALTIS